MPPRQARGQPLHHIYATLRRHPAAVARLRAEGVRVDGRDDRIAWVHLGDTNGLFVELRKHERYD
jgi:hypothetical protein